MTVRIGYIHDKVTEPTTVTLSARQASMALPLQFRDSARLATSLSIPLPIFPEPRCPAQHLM